MLQSVEKHFAIVVAHGEKTTVRREIESVDSLNFFIVKFGKVIVNSQCGHVNLEGKKQNSRLMSFLAAEIVSMKSFVLTNRTARGK